MKTRFLIRLSLLGIALAFAYSARAEELNPPTPEQRIELLKATIATQAEQIKTLTELLQYFQAKPSVPGAQLAAIREGLEKQCGCKLDAEGLPISKETTPPVSAKQEEVNP